MATKAKCRALRTAIALMLCACASPTEEEAIVEGSVGVAAEITDCPEIGHFEAIPLEVVLFGEIAVSAELSIPDDYEHGWTAIAGSFDDPAELDTTYRCEVPGDHTLTLFVAEDTPCETAAELRVSCSFSPTCGDGEVDSGEQCDDGNLDSGDGCSKRCLMKPLPGGD